MYDDEIVTTGACAERKFVCKGMQASIEVFTVSFNSKLKKGQNRY